MTSYRPTADWIVLRRRAALLAQLRQFFCDRGFLEVETPLLSRDTVVDRHLEPFAVDVDHHRSAAPPMWLQTSPEFAMKRLLAAGGEAIFQVARAFRRGERGRCHNPEFTMVEWYRVQQTPGQAMHLLSELADALLDRGPALRLSYTEAFAKYAGGVNPLTAGAAELAEAARSLGISIPDSMSDEQDQLRDLILVDRVEPNLGRTAPTILYDYPASQAALAVVRPANPPVAERFELYVDGLELANGYHELLDADVLLQRNQRINQQRMEDGHEALPEQSRLLEAMQAGLPPCCGVAMGFDRLVMIAVGASHIDQVIPFPVERA